MNVLRYIRERARSVRRSIVLPETDDRRVLAAARVVVEEQLASLVLVTAAPEQLRADAAAAGLDLRAVQVIVLAAGEQWEAFAQEFYQARKHKGVTLEQARQTMSNPVYYAAMMVGHEQADGFVAGARTTTADVAKAAIFCIGFGEKVRTISSAFLVNVPDCAYGNQGVFVFADCGILPDPSPVQLANVAQSAAELYAALLEDVPRVALLSFSTKGSAEHDSIAKVRRARELLAEKAPGLLVDGELQLDAAIVPDVAQLKAADSPVAGRANVLIFPDLNAGNIGYKLVQRLAKADVMGPMMMGVRRPCCDLSRGCVVDEVVYGVCTTAIRASLTPQPVASTGNGVLETAES